MTSDASRPEDPRRLRVVPPGDPAEELMVVGIGASAGGLEAATQLLRSFPATPGMAFVLIQHLDPTHASGLVDLLSRITPLPVREAAEAMLVEADNVYVIPPAMAMTMREGRLHVTPRATTREPQRLIDGFLRSLADNCQFRCAGVILSGTGTDGTHGLEAIKAAGGLTFAQDASAGHEAMPRSAIAAGCVDFVLPPEAIAAELLRLGSAQPGEATASPSCEPDSEPERENDDVVDDLADDEAGALTRIFRVLRVASGVDFASYKQGTVRRRIERRMSVVHATRLADYARLAESSQDEARALYEDILIHVTSFFRDPETFAALKEVVFPALVDARPAGRPIRIWVPGCSTGEEVYSLAIALLEYLGDRAPSFPIKIFGTDISDAVVAKARAASFGAQALADVSPERLRRFFVPDGDRWIICKSVRELCVFARQDATRDPPFSRLDLISCRNVLIYLGPELQARVLPVFHYALDDGGFLLLGKSEAVGAARDLFSVIDAPRGIHARKAVPSRLRFDVLAERRQESETGSLDHGAGMGDMRSRSMHSSDMLREADRLVLSRAPAGVVVDDSMNILQFRGDISPYLAPASGVPSHDVLKMAREGLLSDLRAALEECKRTDAAVRRSGVEVRAHDSWQSVDIEVVPLRLAQSSERTYLVHFEPARAAQGPAPGSRRPKAPRAPGGAAARVLQVERELAATKEYLQSIILSQQASAEQVETANEEILSSNEELQSTNEELQTAQEELQATNEELMTVNDELEHVNRDSALLLDDLTNLLTSVSIPILMMGRDLRIRRFTPAASRVMRLAPADAGRPIGEIPPTLLIPDLEQALVQVVKTLVPVEREVQDHEGRWHLLSIRPYRTQDDKIDGAVLSLGDIDATKRSEQRLAAARDDAESIFAAVHEPLVVLDGRLVVKTANRAFHATFGTVPTDMDGQPFFGIAGGRWNVAGLKDRLLAVLRQGLTFENVSITTDLPPLGTRQLIIDARRVAGADPAEATILVAIQDVTERQRELAERQLIERKLQDTQKVESLGILAGGIAHDFNNILTGILGHANLAELDAPEGPVQLHLKSIEEAVRRAAELCSQMLAYSGRGRFVVKRCDLTALVAEATRLVDLAAGRKAALEFHLAADIPEILVDPTQIRQVVMNLVANAAEAIGDSGGTISISTGIMHADKDYLANATMSPAIPAGDYAYLEVADTGAGMDADTMTRIFDPFFTTKFMGRGLGLAAVLGIVRGHQGALKIDSTVGQGTTFRLLLPFAGALEADIAGTKQAPRLDDSFVVEGTILVVDDEDEVRSVVSAMLKVLGFGVAEAADGFAAVTAFNSHRAEFRLVLLDMTTPRMSGEQTFEQLRKLDPSVRVLLMSGYSEEDARSRFGERGIAGFLTKPFGRNDLLAHIQAALK